MVRRTPRLPRTPLRAGRGALEFGDGLPQLPLTTGPIIDFDPDADHGSLDDEQWNTTKAEAHRWAHWGAARHGARVMLTRGQGAAMLFLLLACIGLLLWQPALLPGRVLVFVLGVITAVYLLAGLHKAWLLARVAGAQGYAPTNIAIADADLPGYTVLVPLHRERKMLPVLVQRLRALDYPTDKLQVLLLIEKDDEATREALRTVQLPPHIQAVTVPLGKPKTKPRALNFGLALANGDYIVVYDAEDAPEPDQLRKAAAAFAALPERVVCLQARLGFYNRGQSLLTRLFALDYLVWYTMVLPGLTQRSAFIPLGGTSNHFRVMPLRRLGGWDPFNVTEDADLGTRLARARLQVAMLDSETGEEAVTTSRAWTRQRSRWIKGYMQTYLVHMRHPLRLLREMGILGWLDFHLLIGGTIFVLLINPMMWALTVAYIVGRQTPLDALIHPLFPSVIYYPGVFCQIVGNFLFVYVIVYASVRYQEYDLTPYAFFGPFYWLLMSLAAWRALLSLLVRPYHWNKTEHGVSIAALEPEAVEQQRMVDEWLRGLHSPPSARAALSLVLPAYNEEQVIARTVQACLAALDRWCPHAELIVVDDGSRDHTGAILEDLAARERRLRVIHHEPNQGYGAALLSGFAASRGQMLAFMDSDGQFDPNDLALLLQRKAQHPDAAILGYRQRRADPLPRKLNAWGWKQATKAVLGLRGVRDIDCAFKLMPGNAVRVANITSRGACVNAELLTKLQRMGVPFEQVAVQHLPRTAGRATGANLRVILRAFAELVRVQARLRRWNAPIIVDGAAVLAGDAEAIPTHVLGSPPSGPLIAVTTPQTSSGRLGTVLETLTPLAVGAALLAACVARLPARASDPAEGTYWQSLAALAQGHVLYTQVYSTQPPLFLRSLFPFYMVLGQTLGAARLGVAVFAVVTLVACATAGRAIGGRWVGAVGSVLLATNPVFFQAAHTLQSDLPGLALATLAVALAALALRDRVQQTDTLAWQAALAFAAGISLGLGIAANLMVVTAVIPVVLYLLAPLAHRGRHSRLYPFAQLMLNLVALGTGGAAAFVGALLAAPEYWPGSFAQSVVAAVGRVHDPVVPGWLTPDALVRAPDGWSVILLAGGAVIGLPVVLLRRNWASLALVPWALGSLSLLSVSDAAPGHVLVLVLPTLALLAGAALPRSLERQEHAARAARAPARPAGRRVWRTALAGTLLGAVTLLALAAAVPDDTLNAPPPTALQTAMARTVDQVTSPHDLLLTDDPYVAGLAGRDVPPELVDTSAARLRGSDLTAARLEAIVQADGVHAILFADGTLDAVPGFQAWVSRYFVDDATFGPGAALYVYLGPTATAPTPVSMGPLVAAVGGDVLRPGDERRD
jgi:cellulose synthase/poly-beta-1,6-N-acetylglucosamine synthase-like glycosyltransferase/4-amino-4-deoxy-L-arabinose transferase-like glycosyltransferase